MRLFVAIDVSEQIRDRINGFSAALRQFAPDVRWMRPEFLHLTLKFIGEQPERAVGAIKTHLEDLSASSFQVAFRGYGFFPRPAQPRIFWVGVEAGRGLTSLVTQIDETMAAAGVAKDMHPFSPHVTLARLGSEAPHPKIGEDRSKSALKNRLQPLQQKLAVLPSPEFGTMTAREFFLYQSTTSDQGSVYTKLAEFKLH